MTNGSQETETTMDEVVESQTGLIRRAPREVVLMPVMDVRLAQQRLQELQEFCANYLQESKDGGTDGGDYGAIPGAGKKKVLFKSGAEKLCDVYGLADRYAIISKVEDFEHGLFDYTIECTLVRKTDEMFVGSGLGACSTWESKYRWRESQRVCPVCGMAAIIKGKAEYGGGWLCWKKKAGCGATFTDNDTAITDQKTGRVENPDIFDYKNTVLKIAKKRAKIDAVIGVTRSSGIFTQDLDEHEIVAAVVEDAAPVRVEATNVRPGPVDAPVAAPEGESHAQKIERIKAEAAAKRAQAPAPITSSGSHPPASNEMHTSSGTDIEPPVPAPPPTPKSSGATSQAQPADGSVFITAINVRNGPMVMKDGKSQPSWGPLFIIAFSHKVKATDGTMVADATTFKQEDAALAEQARDAGQALKPVIEPGSKKGSFKLVRFE